ncbi:MAG: acetyl-CoA C-acyltransferase, partial [Alphaproteobacteria bacterium]
RSQQKAGRAMASGYFAEEIVPVEIPGGKASPTIVDRDEHPRPETSMESLAKLKNFVRDPGTVTAGNASGVNDGACAMIIASAKAVEKYGLKPRARVLGLASAGVAPRIMGVGPIPAVHKLMERLGLKVSAFDVIELNEAFASQGIAVLRGIGVPEDADHVNPNGGAIALGHPLGMSGARIAATAVHQLEKTGGRYGLATMCVGVGQGVALAVERVS